MDAGAGDGSTYSLKNAQRAIGQSYLQLPANRSVHHLCPISIQEVTL